MSEQEPDLSIGGSVHSGVDPSAVPQPNRGEPELVIAADADGSAPRDPR